MKGASRKCRNENDMTDIENSAHRFHSRISCSALCWSNRITNFNTSLLSTKFKRKYLVALKTPSMLQNDHREKLMKEKMVQKKQKRKIKYNKHSRMRTNE